MFNIKPMKCELCGIERKTLYNQTYHFEKTLSGLDNLYLQNITVDYCEKCEDISPYFYRAIPLHKTIAQAIVLQPVPLIGNDIRFLRKHLGLRGKDFAELLHIDAATLSRWENSEQNPSPQSDLLVRTLFISAWMDKYQEMFSEKLLPKITSITSIRQSNFSIYVDSANLSYSYCYQTSSLDLLAG